MQIKDIPEVKKFKFPTYEVVTPHTHKSFLMRSLTVNQESILKESSVSSVKAASIVNQILFECIENKEEPYNTIEGFEKNLTMVDRVALMFGLLVATYGEDQDMIFTCPDCRKEIKIKGNLPMNSNVKLYEGDENLLDKTVQIELPVSKEKAELKIPSLYDEKAFLLTKNISKEISSKVNEYIIIKKLMLPSTVIGEDGVKKDTIMVVDNLLEIYSHICKLPARDRKAIYAQWMEIFGGYGITIEIPITCPDCGRETTFQVNVVEELFRQLS